MSMKDGETYQEVTNGAETESGAKAVAEQGLWRQWMALWWSRLWGWQAHQKEGRFQDRREQLRHEKRFGHWQGRR